MATFPAGPLPTVTEILVAGAWTGISVREDPGVQIARGRADESSRVAPSRCDLVLDNRSGAYSNRLPTSPYYGLLGRNTQLRHRLRWVFDTFTRNVSNGLGSDESPMANVWTTSGGSASDYSVTTSGTGVAQILFSAASARKQAQAGPVLYSCRITGQVKPGVVATGASIDMGFMLRRDAAADTAYEVLVRFEVGATMRLRVNRVVSGSATTVAEVVLSGSYSVNSFMWIVADIKGGHIRARTWNTGVSDPVVWQLDFADTSPITSAGQMGGPIARVQAGNTNVPVTLLWNQIDVSDFRFWGEVPQWPQTWDISGTDVTAPIQAAGILRRLGTGAKPLRSAINRTMAGVGPGDTQAYAYWPGEDANGATQIGSQMPGHPPLVISGDVQLAADIGLAGSSALPTFPVGSGGSVGIPVEGDTGQWVIQWWMNVPSAPGANTNYMEFQVAGGVVSRVLCWIEPSPAPALLHLALYGPSGTLLDSGGFMLLDGAFSDPTAAEFYGSWWMWTIGAQASGTNTAFWLDVTQGDTSMGITLVTIAGEPGVPVGLKVIGNGQSAGHWVAYNDAAFDIFQSNRLNAQARLGWAGETAADRMARLCREEGVPFDLIGNAADTQLMGPQQTATLLANLQACADCDQGILGEPRDAFGLQYRTLRSLLNQTGPALDYAAGRIAPPLQPTEDDQLVRNRVTATRIDGSSATAELTEGSLSTQDPPGGVGLYDSQGTVNAYVDGQLPDMAGWQVRLGTWDEARYPQVSVNFARLLADGQAALAGQVAALDGGDYLSITNPPAWLPPDAIELLAQGYRESHRAFEWGITYNAVPAGPYNAFVIGDQTDGRLDTSGCVLNDAVTSSATSMKLCIWDGPASITTAGRPGDFPFDLAVRPRPMDANTGERVRVTAMSAVTAATFVAAGTGSSGSSGSRTPALPAGSTSGDLILIFASTRNSGTGTVDLPTGWTELLDMGNAALLGRIYDGSWLMPTVTFTGGAANEDTLAQSAALRGMCADLTRVVHSAATQLNASAQNVATPLLGVRRDNCVIVYLGWKQDDYTSVATISGATEIQELSSTAGNDAAQVWDYLIQTTATGVDEDAFTVTGGAAGISRGAVVALAGGYQTATVTRSVNGVSLAQAAGTPVSLWRPARPTL
jgi:hypothetical protein